MLVAQYTRYTYILSSGVTRDENKPVVRSSITLPGAALK